MKKLLLTTAMVMTLPFAANAFDLGAVKGADCNSKAVSIVAEGGKEALALYGDVQAGKEITADSEKLVADLKAYVKDGCAEGHLKKAIAAASH